MALIEPMTSGKVALDRRKVLAGLGAVVLAPGLRADEALAGQTLLLPAKAGTIGLLPGASEAPIWSIEAPRLELREPGNLEVEFRSDLPAPAILNWRGIDGAPLIEPLLARRPLAAGGADTFELPARRAGTFLCDLALLGDSQALPSRALPMIVRERPTIVVDRDEVLLIEEWRLRPDGTALAPGPDPKGTTAAYTINGRASFDLAVRPNERLRLRFINGCQRSVVAVKIDGAEVRVMATDGQPAEPFPARDGALVLAPGGRADVFIDATAGKNPAILLHDGKEARPVGRLTVSGEPARPAPLPPAPPLPSEGLPAKLDLRGASRFELALGPTQAGWVTPAAFAAATSPAFRAKAGRTVVLALTNRSPIATVFHLHGHHFRLLDRLDDGWKPYWLDTLVIEAGQTERIAFAAQHTGRFLIESVATEWAAPRLVRWYGVE